jgi:glycosyltransferase involved in cell wall biosynthesis
MVGDGPEKELLQAAIPTAQFPGWVEKNDLPVWYNKADLLILPSRFDTFGCVVLEALQCGIPVAAYNSKGPMRILSGHGCGILSDNSNDLARRISEVFLDSSRLGKMKSMAQIRASDFQAGSIMKQMFVDLKLDWPFQRTQSVPSSEPDKVLSLSEA